MPAPSAAIQVRLKGRKQFQSKKGPVGTSIPPEPSVFEQHLGQLHRAGHK